MEECGQMRWSAGLALVWSIEYMYGCMNVSLKRIDNQFCWINHCYTAWFMMWTWKCSDSQSMERTLLSLLRCLQMPSFRVPYSWHTISKHLIFNALKHRSFSGISWQKCCSFFLYTYWVCRTDLACILGTQNVCKKTKPFTEMSVLLKDEHFPPYTGYTDIRLPHMRAEQLGGTSMAEQIPSDLQRMHPLHLSRLCAVLMQRWETSWRHY